MFVRIECYVSSIEMLPKSNKLQCRIRSVANLRAMNSGPNQFSEHYLHTTYYAYAHI